MTIPTVSSKQQSDFLLSWVLPGYGHAFVDNDGAFDATTHVPDDLEAALLPLLRTMIYNSCC